MKTLVEHFTSMRELLDKARRHLPFMTNMVDLELILEIGFYQFAGAPMRVKALELAGIRAPARVRFHLRKLRSLGVVVVEPGKRDHRERELRLSPEAQRRFIAFFGDISDAEPLPQEAAIRQLLKGAP